MPIVHPPAPGVVGAPHPGNILRNARLFNFRAHATAESFMDADHIAAEIEELFDLLERRRAAYLLVGGIALLAHVPGRNTEDVDLILSVADQHRLEPEVVLADPGSPFAVGRYKQLRVDYLDAGAPFFALIQRRYAERRRFEFLRGGRELPCATPAGLMLLKLYALPHVTAQGDWRRVNAYEGDILSLWMAYPELDPAKLLAVLRPHVWEGGLFSLEHEVLPDLARRRQRLGQIAGAAPTPDRGQDGGVAKPGPIRSPSEPELPGKGTAAE